MSRCLSCLIGLAVLVTLGHIIQAAHHETLEKKKQIIGLSLPSEDEPDYRDDLQNIADFIMEMDNKTKGLDYLIVAHDQTGWKYFKDKATNRNYKFQNAKLVQLDRPSMDMWMRDFPPVLQTNYTYNPQYISKARANQDKAGFDRFAKILGISGLTQSDVVIEGGNVVENGKDKAITTARIYLDNPGYTPAQLVQELERLTRRTFAVLEDPQDTTGHSDGLVSFVEENTLLISLFEDDPDGVDFYDSMEDTVLRKFPNLQVAPLPCYAKKNKTQGFVSSEGSYANSLVTNNAVYLPFYSNETANQRALAVFRNYTNKTIVPVINTRYIPVYGGSLRCMSWQVSQESDVGKQILEYIRASGSAALTAHAPYALLLAIIHVLVIIYK